MGKPYNKNKDMDGKVALDIFKQPTKPKYIDSWESVSGDFAQHEGVSDSDSLSDQETMQQLVDLGYIEKPDEKIEIAILKTKCDLKHNLARVFLGKKDYESSNEILIELINDDYPKYQKSDLEGKTEQQLKQQGIKEGDSVIDVIPYYMDLLSISLVKKQFEKAEHYLHELRTRDKKFEINTYFSEAKILVGKGKTSEALKLLQSPKMIADRRLKDVSHIVKKRNLALNIVSINE